MSAIAVRRRRRRRMSLFGRIVWGTLAAVFLLVLFVAGTVAGIIYSYSQHLPDISKMADFQPSRSTHVYARDGTLLANLYPAESRRGSRLRAFPNRSATRSLRPRTSTSTRITASTSSASCGPQLPTTATKSFRAPRRSRSSSRASCFFPMKFRSREKCKKRCWRWRSSDTIRRTRSSSATST